MPDSRKGILLIARHFSGGNRDTGSRQSLQGRLILIFIGMEQGLPSIAFSCFGWSRASALPLRQENGRPRSG